ncbi:glucosyl-3-phosphoglycerate synthase [Desulfolithobacter dissulfuricans]|uniref:Glucosyl-3-phosphoglycerate synthase n=1 Tax=Desulfolithobacter dissulfuricans TaxID=2795293 RepID=A0A915U308_9BACT|nr:glucosyl-3-phosphoglycerate synthase [Desulfolithobacter dissulfuricans]BCO09647.1 glucosyl-3-phosphoglycerate synthase [Desulfolithobacter dissulfuricans]
MFNIGNWIETNTFHHRQFWDLLRLIREKEKQGLTISLCIPALNEEKTIGKEVVLFKSELQDRYPLLDEIAVIDSGSTDRTREVAADFGADVYLSADILPEMGFKRGKGENLWKAIYQLKGDIIVYVDADIKNIHPRFAYGLVAPLIYRPEIKYVKAFYDRPLALSREIRPSGGGRVTEILVRPLFSLFFPELTAIIQPLSGEYAVRREILERIPFPVGYGVETSHLIDVYQEWGLEAFAQTDLDQRVHRHQPTRDLGKMAFGILRTFLKRLRERGIVGDLPELTANLRQFQVQGDHYEQVIHEIYEEERPPMIEIPAYREKFGIH